MVFPHVILRYYFFLATKILEGRQIFPQCSHLLKLSLHFCVFFKFFASSLDPFTFLLPFFCFLCPYLIHIAQRCTLKKLWIQRKPFRSPRDSPLERNFVSVVNANFLRVFFRITYSAYAIMGVFNQSGKTVLFSRNPLKHL